MITIKPSNEADSRTAIGEVSKEELCKASKQHIGDVQKAVGFICKRLLDASLKHDYTKIDNEGLGAFYDAYSKKLTGDEFKQCNWFKRHVTEERHHLNDFCPPDVTLIDVIERVCDITMAGLGRSGSVYSDSLRPEVLELAYRNTINLLIDNTIVEKR